MGVKNQNGRIINKINKALIIIAEIFFNFIFLKVQLYTGENTIAKIIPIIIDIKIGFNIKKERTIKVTKIIKDITLLKNSSAISFNMKINL